VGGASAASVSKSDQSMPVKALNWSRSGSVTSGRVHHAVFKQHSVGLTLSSTRARMTRLGCSCVSARARTTFLFGSGSAVVSHQGYYSPLDDHFSK